MDDPPEEEKYNKAFLYSSEGDLLGQCLLVGSVPKSLDLPLGVFKRKGSDGKFIEENGIEILSWDYVKEPDEDGVSH